MQMQAKREAFSVSRPRFSPFFLCFSPKNATFATKTSIMDSKRLIYYIAAAAVAVAVVVYAVSSCVGSPKPKGKKGHLTSSMLLKGDKTVYGLACEGCNDTVVVLLPNSGGDPVTYNILDATRRHGIKGDINIGDWIGVVLNTTDTTKADLVIDLDELKGIWCYIVMPKMRDFEHMSNRKQAQALAAMPDSVKQTYYIPREYGFWLKRQWQAQSVGYVQEKTSLENESPVVYPPLGYFTEWHIWNGYFVMTSGRLKLEKDGSYGIGDLSYDTCSIDYLGNDSLVLTDRDGSRSYYRKNNINEVNKKAKEIAARLSQQALQKTTGGE